MDHATCTLTEPATCTIDPYSVAISNISVTSPDQIDLAASPLQVSQPGATASTTTGLLRINPGKPANVSLTVTGTGIASGETRSTTVQLQAGGQTYTSNPISLSALAAAGSAGIPVSFSVTLDRSLAGTTQTITATVDPGITLGDANFGNNSQSAQVEVVGPKLTITKQVLTQAVSNAVLEGSPANVDLVLGRNTAAMYTLGVTNGTASDTTPVTFTTDLGDGTGEQSVTPSSPAGSITIGQVVANGGTLPVTFASPPLLPLIASPSGQTFTVTFKAKATDAVQNGSAVLTARVKSTRTFSLDYFRLTNPGEDVSSSDFATHIQNSNNLILGMYPLAEGGLASQEVDTPVSFSSTCSSSGPSSVPGNGLTGTAAIEHDLGCLAYFGAQLNPVSQAGIGVVAPNYFEDRGIVDGTLGMSKQPLGGCQPFLSTGSSIVLEGYFDVTAHEVAHTFGLPDLGPGFSASPGYWVDAQRPITSANNLMSAIAEVAFFGNFPYVWPDASDYQCLFQELLLNPVDPETLLVAGTIDQNNKVSLLPLRFLANGVATPTVASSTGTVQLLDSSGNAVAQSSFNSTFTLSSNTGATFTSPQSTFLVQLPASQSGETVQISKAGKVISSFNPNSQLLIDAIRNIPGTSFRNTRREKDEREDLLEQARRIERQLKACQKVSVDCHRGDRDKSGCVSGVLGMIAALRERLDRDLNDSTAATSPQQFTKVQVLATVDFVLLQTLPNRTVRTKTHSFHIREVPDEFRKVVDITAVTQGTHGTVEIEKDGRLLYTPESKTRQADSFTVTLADAEGASVVKTVSLVVPQRDDYDDDERREIFSSIKKIMSTRSEHR